MEVIPEGAGAGSSNVEYEMMQDGATTTTMSSVLNEEDQQMDYAAHTLQAEAEGEEYEVMMEEYGQQGAQEGYTVEAPLMAMEEAVGEEIEEDTGDGELNGQSYVEENTGDREDGDEQTREGYGDEAVDEAEEVADETVEAATEGTRNETATAEPIASNAQSDAIPAEPLAENVLHGKETVAEVAQSEQQEEATSADAKDSGEGQSFASNDGRDPTQGQTIESHVDEAKNETIGAEDGGGAGGEETVGEDEDVLVPPPVRVTFNGQDFVLFPHAEPSTYLSAQEDEPVAAPQLKAEASVFYETLDSLFDALRVKDSLGDFLEEGSELQITFADLEMVLREDDVYAREVTLNDVHRLHLGYGLESSLHLVVSEASRFITRYNELATRVSSLINQGDESREGGEYHEGEQDAGAAEASESQARAVENDAEESRDGETATTTAYEDGEGERAGPHEDSPDEKASQEAAAPGQEGQEAYEEEDADPERTGEEETGQEGEVAEEYLTSQADDTFVTVDESKKEEEEEGEPEQSYEEGNEGEDIVDYEDAYDEASGDNAEGDVSSHVNVGDNGSKDDVGGNTDAEYEEASSKEKSEGSPARQKRQLEDDVEALDETEMSKRARTVGV